jgi:hypothetical protein
MPTDKRALPPALAGYTSKLLTQSRMHAHMDVLIRTQIFIHPLIKSLMPVAIQPVLIPQMSSRQSLWSLGVGTRLWIDKRVTAGSQEWEFKTSKPPLLRQGQPEQLIGHQMCQFLIQKHSSGSQATSKSPCRVQSSATITGSTLTKSATSRALKKFGKCDEKSKPSKKA